MTDFAAEILFFKRMKEKGVQLAVVTPDMKLNTVKSQKEVIVI